MVGKDADANIRRARLEEWKELEREIESAKARNRPVKRRKFYPLALQLGTVAMVVTGLVVGARIYAETNDNYDQEAGKTQALHHALANTALLQANGACADELNAEKVYYTEQAKRAPNTFIKDKHTDTANRYGNAAVLAERNNISCTSHAMSTVNITPNFNVTHLQQNHLCAAKLRMEYVNPDTAQNIMHKRTLELENIKSNLAAALAEKYQVSCS